MDSSAASSRATTTSRKCLSTRTFKVGGKDFQAFAVMVDKLVKLLDQNGATMTFTVSCDKTDLPERIHQYII